MTLCVIDGGHCTCQPDIESWCPAYKPDAYTRHLMRAIAELRAHIKQCVVAECPTRAHCEWQETAPRVECTLCGSAVTLPQIMSAGKRYGAARAAAAETGLTAVADAARLDWLQSWTEGDVQISPPGQHGGAAGSWLVALDSDARPSGTRGYRWSCEASGSDLREAIDNCRRALDQVDA
jgi:hypothetical protein